MRREDVDAVMRIETEAFADPWPRTAFLDELKNPYARIMLAAGEAEIVGYICYWVLGEELLINNLAVDPVVRRRGAGRCLLTHAVAEGREKGCLNAFLEVRPSNAPAVRLYEGFGFRVIQRRPGYYSNTREDALVMQASLKGLESG